MSCDPSDCPIDFNTFVLSLSSNALSTLAEVDEGQPLSPVQRALAKQTVDILELLEQKTTGNLTGEEERLLHQVLDDVREQVASLQGVASEAPGH